MSGLKLRDIQDRVRQLRKWRIDDEVPPSDELVNGIIALAGDAATEHLAYHHYTSIEAFEKIFRSKKLKLSCLSSVKLNDQNEYNKYSDPKVAKRTYVACFNHQGAECANLWWLYAKGSPSTLRISIPQKTFKRWANELRKKGMIVSDVIYAAVKGEDEDYPFERRNTLCWDDLTLHVEDLQDYLGLGHLVGLFKDYEWRAEHETRLIAKRKTLDRLCRIEVPDYVISSMRITLSPWMSDEGRAEIIARVMKCLGRKWKMTDANFRRSVLERAMDALRKDRL